jgi:hypothetical protein
MSSTLFNSLTHNSRKAWLVPPWTIGEAAVGQNSSDRLKIWRRWRKKLPALIPAFSPGEGDTPSVYRR